MVHEPSEEQEVAEKEEGEEAPALPGDESMSE